MDTTIGIGRFCLIMTRMIKFGFLKSCSTASPLPDWLTAPSANPRGVALAQGTTVLASRHWRAGSWELMMLQQQLCIAKLAYPDAWHLRARCNLPNLWFCSLVSNWAPFLNSHFRAAKLGLPLFLDRRDRVPHASPATHRCCCCRPLNADTPSSDDTRSTTNRAWNRGVDTRAQQT